MTQKRFLRARNGRRRGDGYDAYARPVNAKDRAPGGIAWIVRYVPVHHGEERILWCDTQAAAFYAAKWGAASDGASVDAPPKIFSFQTERRSA